MEEHYGKQAWIHRKGAIRAGKDELGEHSRSEGSFSYLVMGLGNPESFESYSHGAGRRYSRTNANQRYSVEEVLKVLKECRVVLGKYKKSNMAEESHIAYKNIDFVIQNELDLVKPEKKLRTLGVVKG